ncbi:hypothetical protein HU200_012986 [Digitaria exilis]|uniref:WH2 domain-containing protein n=1 Tax=Digitaria exilis TaxID=1010633 RepID=A0A835FDB1_9POAL|nr:hypothetical protein HU200_012986 [Digitaria exilis]
MIRYQIRNEYGLSDPELFAAAPGEEDDPEALLEGVAMAGLVGLLRQLGDLADVMGKFPSSFAQSGGTSGKWGIRLFSLLFAAEMFHDLHEDVMATASRGHGLMLRLQQLEAEFPAVEKALISQTDHSNYPHDDGVEWHANLQLKQNMVTQGDMPRFILDSYEECRGPPQLFTLDKFDVAGAGASLKRYSDPSFFKTEHTPNMIEMDVSIEKKPRRIKAIRWRKGATLQALLIANSESSDSSEMTSPFGEMDNLGAIVQSSGKLELSKVVPVNESDTFEIVSAPTDASAYKRIPGKEHEPSEGNAMVCDSEKLQDCPTFQAGEIDHSSHSGHEETPLLTGVLTDQDADGCRPDDIGSDQDNFIDALNNMDREGEAEPEIENEFGPIANVEQIKLNHDINEGENALYEESPEVSPAIDSPPRFNSSCNGGQPTCTDLPYLSDPAPSAVSATNCPSSGSQSGSGRQLDGVDCTQDKEPSDDEDLMGVSSSSSVASDCADLQTSDLVGCQQHQEEAYHYLSGDHAAVIHSSEKHSPKTSSELDGMAGCNDETDKARHSVEHAQDIVLDDSSILSQPNDVSEDEGKISFGIADDLFLQPTKPNQEEIQQERKKLEEGGSQDTDSPGIFASWPDKDHAVVRMNDVEMEEDDVTVPEIISADTASTGLDPDDNHDQQDGIAPENSDVCNNLSCESYDDEIAEDMHSLLDDDLSTSSNKHAAEDNQLVVLEGGACSTSLNTHRDNSMQATSMARDSTDVEELPVVIQGVPSQEETEVLVRDALAPATCVSSDDTEPLEIGVPLAPSANSLPDTSNSCVEQHALTEMGDIAEDDKVLVAEESTDNTFANGDGICTEKTEDYRNYNSTEEASSHDLQLQHSSPLREGVETVESTHRNLGEVGASREYISEKRIFKTDIIHPLSEKEPTSKKCSDRDEFCSSSHSPVESGYQEELLEEVSHNAEVLSECDLDKDGAVSLKNSTVEKQPVDVDQVLDEEFRDEFRSSSHSPGESDYQEELLEEASHNAEVLSECNLDKDGAVSLKSSTVEKQPVDVDQDLVWGMPAQDSTSTNPFMDPAYMMCHTQTQNYQSPSASCQPYFPEEQDFLSEILMHHENNMGAAADSLWEPATPPDEAPLPSEVMTEEDFRSFCHEYHEIDSPADTEGCHCEPTSESNNISNAFLVNESDFPNSVSASFVVKLDQEACVHSKFSSQCDECSSTMDLQGASSRSVSDKEDLKDETPGVYSHIESHLSFSDNRNPELHMLSAPVDLQQEHHVLSGVDSHFSSPLSDKEKSGEGSCFPSSNFVEVKQDLEVHTDCVQHSSVNENVDKLDVSVPVETEVGARALDGYDNPDVPCCSTSEKDDAHTLGERPMAPSSSIDETEDNLEVSALRTSFQKEQESERSTSGEHDSRITLSPLLDEKIDKLGGPPLSKAALLDEESEVSRGLDSQTAQCTSTDENMHDLDRPPLSSSVLVDPESEDHVSHDSDSQVTTYSLVKDKIDVSEYSQPNHVFPEELGQEALASHELDFQVAPYSLNDDKVGEKERSPSCNGYMGSEKESDCSTEFDSQTAPCSSNSPMLADTRSLTSTAAMPSNEETYQLSPGPLPAVQFQNGSYENPQDQAPPPLPPLQWRLGRPRLGFPSRKSSMPEPSRRLDLVLQESSQDMDTRSGLHDQTDRSIEPVSSQAIKEDTYQSSLLDNNDQNVEFGRLSTSLTGVATTEHHWPFSEYSENIRGQEHICSSATVVNENLDAGVTSATADEEHLDDSGVAQGAALYTSDLLLSLPRDDHQEPQLCILSSDTRETSDYPSHMHLVASENDKSTVTAGGMENTSTKGHDSELRCYQQPQHVVSFPKPSDHEESITHASEDGLKHQPDKTVALSDTAKHSALGTVLKEGQILQEQIMGSSEDDQLGGPLPSSESMAPQDYPQLQTFNYMDNQDPANSFDTDVSINDHE